MLLLFLNLFALSSHLAEKISHQVGLVSKPLTSLHNKEIKQAQGKENPITKP